jgi:hypothetical protein
MKCDVYALDLGQYAGDNVHQRRLTGGNESDCIACAPGTLEPDKVDGGWFFGHSLILPPDYYFAPIKKYMDVGSAKMLGKK